MSYITQLNIKLYHSMRHMSSPLFLVVRAPTLNCWQRSRIINITRQHTDQLLTLHRTLLIIQWTTRSILKFLLGHEFMFSTLIISFFHIIKSYSRKIGTYLSHKFIFLHDIYEVLSNELRKQRLEPSKMGKKRLKAVLDY